MSPNDIATAGQLMAVDKKIDKLIEAVQAIAKPSEPQFEVYLTSKQVCDIYHLSKSKVSQLRTEGKLPYTNAFDVLLHPQSKIDKVLMESLQGVCPRNQ